MRSAPRVRVEIGVVDFCLRLSHGRLPLAPMTGFLGCFGPSSLPNQADAPPSDWLKAFNEVFPAAFPCHGAGRSRCPVGLRPLGVGAAAAKSGEETRVNLDQARAEARHIVNELDASLESTIAGSSAALESPSR